MGGLGLGSEDQAAENASGSSLDLYPHSRKKLDTDTYLKSAEWTSEKNVPSLYNN
jgi:hypothetical protein